MWIERYFLPDLFRFCGQKRPERRPFFEWKTWVKIMSKNGEKMTRGGALLSINKTTRMKTLNTKCLRGNRKRENRSQTKPKKKKFTRERPPYLCALQKGGDDCFVALVKKYYSPLGHQRKNNKESHFFARTRLPLFFFSLLSKRRDYVVAFGASLTCARNFSSKCSVSTLETNKFKLVLPFQHVMANSDRHALSFWTSSSRSKQTKEP